jgi:hypothetical protein
MAQGIPTQVKGPRSKAGLAPQALVPFKTPLKASEARWLSTAEGGLKRGVLRRGFPLGTPRHLGWRKLADLVP